MDSSFTLRPPRREVVLGLLALVPTAAMGVLILVAWRRGGGGLVAAALTLLLTAAGAAWLLAWALRSRVVVRDIGMERVGVLGRRLIGWPAVARIAFNPAQRWFFLTMADGSHLWLRTDVEGIGDFAAVALRRVRPEALEADPFAREVLEDLARRADEEPQARPRAR